MKSALQKIREELRKPALPTDLAGRLESMPTVHFDDLKSEPKRETPAPTARPQIRMIR